MGEKLSGLDKQALALAMTLDSTEKIQAYREALLEKWSGHKNGQKLGSDWIGKESVERGFPELKRDADKVVMATRLENQFRFQRSREQRVVGGLVIVQDTAPADEARPTKFAAPT